MQTRRFGRKMTLPATMAIKHQIRMLMAQYEDKKTEASEAGAEGLQQTIGLLKSNQRLVCNSCGVGISFDTAKLAAATEVLQEALETVPDEITVKFFR